jgi:hypothetical protein
MARSENKSDFWGNNYTQHYDDNGNESGTSESKTTFFGDRYTQYYDNNGNDKGTSESKTTFFGDRYTQHYNSNGDDVGTSESKKDFWGNSYVQHYNGKGEESGTSVRQKDFWGNSYIESKNNGTAGYSKNYSASCNCDNCRGERNSNAGFSKKYSSTCDCASCKAERNSKPYIATCNCASCKSQRNGKKNISSCNCDSCRSARGGQYYSKPSSGFCYLTTACIKYRNLGDNCYELETLRNFRDSYILNRDNGVELVKEYYTTAPLIISKIDKQIDSNEIYEVMYYKIKEAVHLIEQHQLEKAFTFYCEIANDLKHKYLD